MQVKYHQKSASNTDQLQRCLMLMAVLLALVGLSLGCLSLALQPDKTKAVQNVASESLIWPLSGSAIPDSTISSPFGPRWQASQARYDYHPGIDIAAPQGTPVQAIASGTVFKVGWLSPSSGLSVIVNHPSLGFYSAYLHLDSTPVFIGQAVSPGEVIGYVGNSGTTEFYHLHTEIRLSATGYPTSTRNPMGYLPRPEVTTPTIRLLALEPEPIYSPTVSLVITAPRDELDLNQIRVALHDRATAALIDEQFVDFNLRAHTGSDTLDQDGIRLEPSHFNTTTAEYLITATFYSLIGFDSFTLTAQAIDLAGHAGSVTAAAADTTPPERVTSLRAGWRRDGGVDLTWIAPGDSGGVGTAHAYDVRFAPVPITPYSWYSAVPLFGPPAPLPGGQTQTWLPAGLFPDPVYFAMRATDAEGNASPVSNSAQAMWRISLPVIVRRP